MRPRYRTHEIAQLMSILLIHSMCDTTYAPQLDADNPRWPRIDTRPIRRCQFESQERKNTL